MIAVTRALASRGLTRMVRVPTLLVPAIVMPVFFVIAFSGSFSAVVAIEGYATDRSVNWMTAWAVLQGSAFAGVGAAGSVVFVETRCAKGLEPLLVDGRVRCDIGLRSKRLSTRAAFWRIEQQAVRPRRDAEAIVRAGRFAVLRVIVEVARDEQPRGLAVVRLQRGVERPFVEGSDVGHGLRR